MGALTPALAISIWNTDRILSFASPVDVLSWAKAEQSRWEAFVPGQNGRFNKLLAQQKSWIAAIAAAAETPGTYEALAPLFVPVSNGTATVSDSPYFTVAESIASQDREAGFFGIVASRSDAAAQIAAAGLTPDVIARFAVLVGPLAQEVQGKHLITHANELARLKSQYDSGLSEVRQNQIQLDTQRATSVEVFNQDQIDRNESWALELENVRAEWARLKAVYDTELGLRAPTTYWTQRGSSHRTQAICFGIGFGVALATLIVVFSNFGLSYLTDVPEGRPAVLAVLPILIPAFAGIWILRILGRMLSESLQLMRDARERETLVKTFLALMKDEVAGKSVIKDEDRILILHALFRPSSVTAADDAPPVNWLETLARTGPRR